MVERLFADRADRMGALRRRVRDRAHCLAISVGAAGTLAILPIFWTLPAAILDGAAAAGAIAMINALGNVGGFAGPFVIGWIKDATGSYAAGLYFLAGCAVVSSTIAVVALRERRRALAAEPAE